MDFTKCIICDSRNSFRKKIKCPSGSGKFCKNCVKEYIQRLLDNNNITGIVSCPCGCGESINSKVVKYKSNSLEQLFDAFIEQHRDYAENRREEIFEEKTIQEKIDKGEEITEQELLNYINDKILTTSCPNCGVAYDGFDGCCALECSSCDTNFCAYCREPHLTNQQNHDHVLDCEFNLHSKGEYFADDVNTVNNAYVEYKFEKLIETYPMYEKSIYTAFDKEIVQQENIVVQENKTDKYLLYGAIIGIGFGIGFILGSSRK